MFTLSYVKNVKGSYSLDQNGNLILKKNDAKDPKNMDQEERNRIISAIFLYRFGYLLAGQPNEQDFQKIQMNFIDEISNSNKINVTLPIDPNLIKNTDCIWLSIYTRIPESKIYFEYVLKEKGKYIKSIRFSKKSIKIECILADLENTNTNVATPKQTHQIKTTKKPSKRNSMYNYLKNRIIRKRKNASNCSQNQQYCSHFGAVVSFIENAKISCDANSLKKEFVIMKHYQTIPATIVQINVKMPDGELFKVTYNMDYAQAYVDELLSNGGIIESVGVVSELTENYYRKYNIDTGTVRLNQITPSNQDTILSKDVQNVIKQYTIYKQLKK